jgi:hypothetical protein
MLTTRKGLCAFLLTMACCLQPAWARADDLDRPYDLQVVVHFGQHRLLSDDFRKQVERELGDDLRVSLGDLVRVRVVSEHKDLGVVQRDGLAVLDSWPAGSSGRSGVKTHFVLIDYRDGQYDIRTRQHDETTGLASPGPANLYGRPRPVIRQERTQDRAFVAALAAGLVEQDFGLLGTVEGMPDKDGQVKVRLQGGARDGTLDRLVRPGEVFAVVAPPGRSTPGLVLPWALLRVEQAPRDGVCLCRYFSRHDIRLREGNQCILLGTVTGPLQMHLVVRDAQKREDSSSLTLEVRRKNFEDKEFIPLPSRSRDERLLRTPDTRPFANLGFVTVVGRRDRPVIPVALIDNEPVEIELTAEPERDPLRFSRENWEQNVRASFLKIEPLLNQLNSLTSEAKGRKEALTLARSGLEGLRADQGRLSAQRKVLWEEAETLPPDKRPSLAAGDELLRQMRENEEKLEQWVARLDALEKEEPQRQAWIEQVVRAQGLENQLEIGKALEIYKKVIQEGFKDKDLEDRVRKLEAIWRPINEEHGRARAFLYDTWPKLTTTKQLLDNVKKAEDALDVCIKAKDRFGPKRLLTATLEHCERLNKEAARLNPVLNVGDVEPVEKIKEANEKLEALALKANEYLRTAPPGQ